MNRRDFMKRSMGVLAATSAMDMSAANSTPRNSAAAQLRTLGRTGLQCTRLGVGTGTRAWNKNSAQIRAGREVYLKTLTRAYELGVRYYDLADMYGSHEYMRDVMADAAIEREELFLLTKTVAKTGEETRADLERMLKETGTDYFDAVLLHCMTAGDWPERMDECMEALDNARSEGLVKATGVSCHHMLALQTAAEHAWVDIILARINPFGSHMDGTQDEIMAVLDKARANGKGVVGMKILGEGRHADEKEKCIEFAMGLDCIDAFTIGFLNAGELEEIVALMDGCAAPGIA